MSNVDETKDIGHVVTADELTIDEGAIIREQERLANERKKKAKRKKLKIVLLVLLILILAATVWFFVWGRKKMAANTQNTVKIETTANQTIEYVRVDSINGNEIKYTKLSVLSSNIDSDASSTTPQDGSAKPHRPSGGFPGGSRPEGGESFDGRGNVPSASRSAVLTYDDVSYALTDISEVAMIPVGTEVTTKLGTKTTFSRIAAGDYLAFAMETIDGVETIMAVYIVG